MEKILLLFTTLLLTASAAADVPKKYLIVKVPFADIRSEPLDAKAPYIKDDLQETQVLYNEPLLYKKENAGWYYVEAIEQKEFTHNKVWQGYPGWIRKSCVFPLDKIPGYNIVIKEKTAAVRSSPSDTAGVLFNASMGTRFNAKNSRGEFYKVALLNNKTGWVNKACVTENKPLADKQKIRENLIIAAKSLPGTPYAWGARGITSKKQSAMLAGVDCSGLTSLIYRANNIDIPRDAHEQWLAARKISANDLKPGDLIFLSKENKFETIVHVMLCLDKNSLIEAPGTGDLVRIKTFKEKFGRDLSGLAKQNFISKQRKIYFGRIKELDE